MLLVILGKNYVSGGIISYISCIYVKIKHRWSKMGRPIKCAFKLCIFHKLCK